MSLKEQMKQPHFQDLRQPHINIQDPGQRLGRVQHCCCGALLIQTGAGGGGRGETYQSLSVADNVISKPNPLFDTAINNRERERERRERKITALWNTSMDLLISFYFYL